MIAQPLTHQQALHILRLRTVIARAAQKDSLAWWEDEALTTQGKYLIERIFPGAPAVTGRNLALAAAAARHQAALHGIDQALHLFHLSGDNADRLAMRAARHQAEDDLPSLSDPIPDFETLRRILLDRTGKQPRYEKVGVRSQYNGMRIRLREPSPDILDVAHALAWAYLEGEVGKPVFPYVVE